MRRRNEKGFTLIEVVVVVAVIAILAAVLTPYITKYIDDSKIAKARNEVQVVAAAVTNAYKDLGRWPNRNTAAADYGGLYTGATTPAAAFFGAATGWAAPGARGIPWTPTWSRTATPTPPPGTRSGRGPTRPRCRSIRGGGRTIINAANFQTQPAALARPSRSGSSRRGRMASSRPTSQHRGHDRDGGDDIGFRVR